MRIRRLSSLRSGVAAVELAVVLPFVFLLVLGTWELGRTVQVYQILNDAAREGARIAAQGQIINLLGSYTQINVNTGSPDVFDAVKNTLHAAGINTASFDTSKVTFTFVDSSGNDLTSPTQPWQGTKGMRFKITATLPYSAFRWTTLNLLNISQIQVTFYWASLIDDPFTVNTTLPSWLGY
jgi:Flp pilus assembly protein TadG